MLTHATNKARQRFLASERFPENIVASPCFWPKTTMFPWSCESPLLRQPGYQAHDLIQGFAPPPHSGFAFLGKGSSAFHASYSKARPLKAREMLVKLK